MSKVACEATTRAGKPCKGGAKKGEEFCGPHLNAKKSVDAPMSMEEYNEQFWKEYSNCFVVAGTGARELQIASTATKAAAHDYLTGQLEALKEKYEQKLIILTGGAEGFDALLAKVALECGINLFIALPNKGYGKYYWERHSVTGSDRKPVFDWYLEQASQVIYACDKLYSADGTHSNLVRNQYMVDHADAFYVYDKKSRGTSDCFRKLVKAGLPYKEVPVVK